MKNKVCHLQIKTLFIVIIVIFLLPTHFFSEQYVVGGKNGWGDVVTRNGITEHSGRFGNTSLVLETNSQKKNEWTDLLLKFENTSADSTDAIVDSVGNYEVVENNLFISDNARMGKSAALSRGNKGGLVLFGKDGSFFSTEGRTGSFEIDFWICPSIVENGEIILNWRSSRHSNKKIMYQLISATFYKDTIMWMFSNIFDNVENSEMLMLDEKGSDVVLYGTKKLVPGNWSHHALLFNEDTGLLSYKVDGETEDMKFLTETGHENSDVFQCILGTRADIEICPKYTGLIDDFVVFRSYLGFDNVDENEKHLTFTEEGGRFESQPIFLKQGTTINSLIAETNLPKETGVNFYIRGGNNRYNWTDTMPEWIQVASGEKINNLTGTYFQVAADLFPDGNGEKTPSVYSIAVDYTPLPIPLPPNKITAKSGDGSVTLSWNYSVDDTTGGYFIFYGERPGEYLGCDAIEGASPIDVGNKNKLTITGLKNGKLYYFAISAWSKIDKNISCPLSKEVYARPSKK